jgi:hypothetical protein
MSIEKQPRPMGISQENKEKLKKLFVDVGFGDYPVIDYGNRQFGEDETYLGLDLDNEKIREFSGKYKEKHNVQFKKVEGDQDGFRFLE